MSRSFSTAFFSILFAVPLYAGAPVEAEGKVPYVWRVILKTKPHPLLGESARKQLAKDLKASLRPALGDELGTVEVIDLAEVPQAKWEPIWKKFDEKGLAELESNEFRTLSGIKTHALTVEVVNGRYKLESRQHDGSTGLASPQIRSYTVSDVELLSRTAGLMLAADFGPVATVEKLDEPDSCLIRLRGGGLPGIDRWLKVGDVYGFAVIQDVPRPMPKDSKPIIAKPGEVAAPLVDRKGQPQAFTLLRVTELVKPGIAKCEIFTRFQTPFVRGRNVVGYRAMKLATREGKLGVRIQNEKGQPPPPEAPMEVWATEFGFRAKPNNNDALSLRNGQFTTVRNLRGVGCVVIKLGTGNPEWYPVPVLDTGNAIPLQFEFTQALVKKARFEEEGLRFLNKTLDARQGQDELIRVLGVLIEQQENKKALDRANGGLKSIAATDLELTAELGRLKTQQAQDPELKDELLGRTLATAEQLLATYRDAKPTLETTIEDLKTALAKADNPAEYERKFRANEYTRTIAQHERRGEIPEALEVYDRLIEFTNLDDARNRKKKLEEAWLPKDAEHEAARKYLRDEWTKLSTTEEIKAAIPKLKTTVEELSKKQDLYGLRYVGTALLNTNTRLGDLLNTLDLELDQDRDKVKEIKSTIDALRKIDELAEKGLKELAEKK